MPNTGLHRMTDPRTGDVVTLKPGDIIECEPEQLGCGRDKFEALDPEPPPTPPPFPKTGLRVVSRGAGWFDVINPTTGMPINDHALRFEDASALAQRAPMDQPPEPIIPETPTNPVQPSHIPPMPATSPPAGTTSNPPPVTTTTSPDTTTAKSDATTGKGGTPKKPSGD